MIRRGNVGVHSVLAARSEASAGDDLGEFVDNLTIDDNQILFTRGDRHYEFADSNETATPWQMLTRLFLNPTWFRDSVLVCW